MQIIIPMAGRGSRFLDEGFTTPKPLIDIHGMSMIEWVLKTLNFDGRFIFVINSDIDPNELGQLVARQQRDFEFVITDEITEGPACSVLLCEKHIDVDDELIVANCDQIMDWHSSLFLEQARKHDGSVVTYHADTPKNSYAKIDRFNRIIEIKEKEVISNISLNGIHYWKKARYFLDSAKLMIDRNDRAGNGEFYVGPSYNHMIAKGLTVGIYHVPNQQHFSVGTPDDLEAFLINEKAKT